MKKFLSRALLVSFLIPVAAGAIEQQGSSHRKAPLIYPAPEHAQQVTLVPSWEEGEEWSDDGTYWCYADLTRGSDYVFWLSDTDGQVLEFYDVTISPDAPIAPIGDDTKDGINFPDYTPPDKFDGNDEDVTYYYVRASEWEEWHPTRVYFQVSGFPGETCTLHVQSRSIADFAPLGSDLHPIDINVSTASSIFASNPGGAAGCYFRTTLPASNIVVFVATPSDGDAIEALEVLWRDASALLESAYTDPVTGVYILKVMAEKAATVDLSMAAGKLDAAKLEWRGLTVGDIGFALPSCKVRDDCGSAFLTVSRTSNDFAERIRWRTVADTAEPGIDYIPATGEVTFEADGDYSADIAVEIKPGAVIDGNVRTLAVRLERIPDGELGEDEYSPEPTARVARIFIEPTSSGEPIPAMPAAESESGDTLLATGTFAGVSEVYDGCAVRLVSRTDGTVSVVVGYGEDEYRFEGDTNEVVCTKEVLGKNYTMYLAVSLPTGTVADLAAAPGGTATVTGSIYTQSRHSMEVLEDFFSCELYREESRLHAGTLGRMRRKAGRYTIALESANELDDPASCRTGYLTANVQPGGDTEISGLLPSGERIASFATVAYDTEEGLSIPICWMSGESADNLLGTLKVGGAPCELLNCGDAIVATAGKYDYWTRLDRLYSGWCLKAEPGAGEFANLEFIADSTNFSVFGVSVTTTINRETGVITGSYNGETFEAVLLNQVMENGMAGAIGALTASDGESRSKFVMYLNWMDPTWMHEEQTNIEVAVGFDLDGGSANTVGTLVGVMGQTLLLPDEIPEKADNVFAGWLDRRAFALHAAGEEISVPPEDTTLVAVWNDTSVASALDSELGFCLSPSGKWHAEENSSAVDGTCLAASGLAANNTAAVSAYVLGPGDISFGWEVVSRASSRNGTMANDTFGLTVDGVQVAVASNAFGQCYVEIAGAGLHLLEWTYVTDSTTFRTGYQTEKGHAWLDGVFWEPYVQDLAVIALDPGEGGSVNPQSVRRRIYEPVGTLPVPECPGKSFVRWVDSVTGMTVDGDTLMPYDGLSLLAVWGVEVSFDAGGGSGTPPPSIGAEIGQEVLLPPCKGLSKEEHEFAGWSDGVNVYAAGTSYVVSSQMTFTAAWRNVRYAAALDCEDAEFAASNDALWVTQEDGDALNGSCLKSAVSTAGGTAELTATVSGAGTLSFNWRLLMATYSRQPQPSDKMELYVDGALSMSLTDGTAWTRESVTLDGEGTHVIRWVYTATVNPRYISSWGAGFLDAVSWEPDGERATVTFDANGGQVAEETRSVRIDSAVGKLPTATLGGHQLVGWFTSVGDGSQISESTIVTGNVTYCAHWAANNYSVAYDFAGGAAGEHSPTSATYGTAMRVSVPMWIGHEFTGWTVGGVDTNSARYGISAESQPTSITNDSQLCFTGPGVAIATYNLGMSIDGKFWYEDTSLVPTGTYDAFNISNLTAKMIYGIAVPCLNTDPQTGFLAVPNDHDHQLIMNLAQIYCLKSAGQWCQSVRIAAQGDGTEGDVWFLNLTQNPGGTVTLAANWRCLHYSTVVTNYCDPTCTEPGYTGDEVCAECGEMICEGEMTDPWGHVEGDGEITKKPTLTETGVITYRCVECGEVVRTETIPMIALTLDPSSASHAWHVKGGGAPSGTFDIVCSTNWTVASPDGWISITGDAGGSGNGTVAYSIAQNDGSAGREGTIVVTPSANDEVHVTFSISQSGRPSEPTSVVKSGVLVEVDMNGYSGYEFPADVTAIGACAFSGCSELESVVVPASVTSIGDSAFEGCSCLTNVVFEGDAPAAGSNIFKDTPNTLLVTVWEDRTGWPEDGQTWPVSDAYGRGVVVCKSPCTVSFAAGGASGETPSDKVIPSGMSIVLPQADGLSMSESVFAGWSDGAGVYAAGASYAVATSMTFTATWRNAKYAAALDCEDVAFAASNDALWVTQEDGDALKGSCLKSAVSTAGGTAELTATVSGAGTLSFSWGLLMATYSRQPKPSDKMHFYVDGALAMSLTAGTAWTRETVTLDGEGTHVIRWVYTATANARYLSSWGAGFLDAVSWTPDAPVDFSDAVVTETTTATDLGITNGTFAAESAGSTNLVKLVEWAKKNGVTVADVNAMTFTTDPQTTLEAAYLLDCSEAEVEAKAAEFTINAISMDSEGNVVLDPADGSQYGNGTVEVRYSDTPGGEFTPTKPIGTDTIFMRIFLVK